MTVTRLRCTNFGVRTRALPEPVERGKNQPGQQRKGTWHLVTGRSPFPPPTPQLSQHVRPEVTTSFFTNSTRSSESVPHHQLTFCFVSLPISTSDPLASGRPLVGLYWLHFFPCPDLT